MQFGYLSSRIENESGHNQSQTEVQPTMINEDDLRSPVTHMDKVISSMDNSLIECAQVGGLNLADRKKGKKKGLHETIALLNN